ncbi:extracellular solute-binding protein [Paenibacillaceae bacterium]|nr:extracellular solute-binding protein [Paenibacillaceae bacterium]
MKKMKPLALFSFVIILLFSLAACSSGGKETQPNSQNTENKSTNEKPDNESSNEEAKTEEPPAEEETYDLDGREIRFSAWWDGTPNAETPEGEKALKRQAEVEKKYNIKIKHISQDYWETAEKFSSTVMGGEPYADVVMVPANIVLSLLKGGYLTALDDVMNVKEETRLSDQMIEAGSYGTGKTYGFLTSAPLFDNTGLLYNKRIFEEAGLPTPTEYIEKGEWDWDTFVDVTKQLTLSKSGSGKIDQWGLTGSAFSIGANTIYSNGGVIYDENAQKIAVDSPEAMEGLEFLNKLFNEYKVVKRDEGNNWEDPARYFREGQIAMYPTGLFEVAPRFLNQMEDEYGFVPFPKGPKADKIIMGQPQLHVNAIPRGVKDPKIVYKIWEDLQNFDTIEDDNLATAETWFSDEDSVNHALNTFNIMRFARYSGLNVEDTMWTLFNDVMDGKVTPAAGVAQLMPTMQANVDKILKGE